jgi:hypothetical protein
MKGTNGTRFRKGGRHEIIYINRVTTKADNGNRTLESFFGIQERNKGGGNKKIITIIKKKYEIELLSKVNTGKIINIYTTQF